jgi:chemotaxis protein methyltransferase CheR
VARPAFNRAENGRTLSADHYEVIRGFLVRRAGIELGAAKEYLVTSRLTRLIREFGLNGFDELTPKLNSPTERSLQVAVIDAMTTNETFWFRDPSHYRILTDAILPEFENRRLRIWSAACSSGQEPYSLVMSIQDVNRRPSSSYEILGTDISTRVLAEAREGRYCGLATYRGLSEEQRRRYFVEQGDCVQVRDEYRRGVSFRELNLTQPFSIPGRFDVVFCRNVLIYFSAERKRDIIERIAQVLNPGGYLLVGSTESMNAHADLFEMRSAFGGLYFRKR